MKLSKAERERQRRLNFTMSWKTGAWADPANRHWMCAEVLYEKAVEAKKRYEEWIRKQAEGLIAGTIPAGQRTSEGEERLIHLEYRGFIHG